MLRATYISVPQVRHTYACVLLKPHWIWGAEMGWNEFGLNIGNEAVFTREKREKQDGLIGMDLLRLALERCRSAKEALKLITTMIGEYGQGGNCGFHKAFYYDNAFLIADENEAYVLETAGRSWAVKKAGEVETISNCLGLRADYEAVLSRRKRRFQKGASKPSRDGGCRRGETPRGFARRAQR